MQGKNERGTVEVKGKHGHEGAGEGVDAAKGAAMLIRHELEGCGWGVCKFHRAKSTGQGGEWQRKTEALGHQCQRVRASKGEERKSSARAKKSREEHEVKEESGKSRPKPGNPEI